VLALAAPGQARNAATVASRLRSRIAAGLYPPGTLLPTERQLAGEFGVARNTLRKALEALQDDGLLRHEERRGVLVAETADPAASGLFLLLLPTLDGCSPATLTPEAMALIGSTLCACGGSDIRLHLESRPAGGPEELLRRVSKSRFRGVLLIECQDEALLAALREEGIPHVVVNQEADLVGPATRVDFWRIGRLTAEHLLNLGHERLGALGWRPGHYLYERMLAGYRGRAAESEAYVDPAHVVPVISCSEASRTAALELLASPGRPTALFCTRDVRAYGAYLAARELGLRVPEELSLVGYDDITWPGEGRRFLTTFPEPTAELGRAAIVMLTTQLKTGQTPEDVVICPELVIRQSTAPCGISREAVSTHE
jgi:DNA-binding LacI/PurR family transcriptional regulator